MVLRFYAFQPDFDCLLCAPHVYVKACWVYCYMWFSMPSDKCLLYHCMCSLLSHYRMNVTCVVCDLLYLCQNVCVIWFSVPRLHEQKCVLVCVIWCSQFLTTKMYPWFSRFLCCTLRDTADYNIGSFCMYISV